MKRARRTVINQAVGIQILSAAEGIEAPLALDGEAAFFMYGEGGKIVFGHVVPNDESAAFRKSRNYALQERSGITLFRSSVLVSKASI